MKRAQPASEDTAKPKKAIQATSSNSESSPTTSTASPSSLIMARSQSKAKLKPKFTYPSVAFTDSQLNTFTILGPEFFQVDALDLAPRLLGKFLRKDDVVLQITEVEAYRSNDSACHGRFGVTARTAPVFGPAGRAYVYLCYGLHTMLNVVADKEGVGAAVLIRSCAPVRGMEKIQQRRGQKTLKPILLTGPGKIGQALGISTEWSDHPLYIPVGGSFPTNPRGPDAYQLGDAPVPPRA